MMTIHIRKNIDSYEILCGKSRMLEIDSANFLADGKWGFRKAPNCEICLLLYLANPSEALDLSNIL